MKKEVVDNSLPFNKTCQNCLQKKKSTYSRTYETKNYQGPCGDSFCYASCDMDACHPVTATICNDCLKKLEKKTK